MSFYKNTGAGEDTYLEFYKDLLNSILYKKIKSVNEFYIHKPTNEIVILSDVCVDSFVLTKIQEEFGYLPINSVSVDSNRHMTFIFDERYIEYYKDCEK